MGEVPHMPSSNVYGYHLLSYLELGGAMSQASLLPHSLYHLPYQSTGESFSFES